MRPHNLCRLFDRLMLLIAISDTDVWISFVTMTISSNATTVHVRRLALGDGSTTTMRGQRVGGKVSCSVLYCTCRHDSTVLLPHVKFDNILPGLRLRKILHSVM